MAVVSSERGLLSERVGRLKKDFLNTVPELSMERFKSLMEAYKETEGQPPALRRARVLARALGEMSIYIDDNPVVGSLTQYLCGVQPYPEWSSAWMRKQETFLSYKGPVKVCEEDRELLREAADYWSDKCLVAKAQEIWSQKHKGISRTDIAKSGVWIDAVPAPLGRIIVDYEKVLNRGLEGVIKEAEEELDRLPVGIFDSLQKRYFLNAVVRACRAVVGWAHRYASLAREMAQREADPQRREELLRIGETCEWVPERPARTFYEAIQSFWFTHIVTWIENCHGGVAPGRFCEYMYPFYKRDKEEGKISDEEALELLELLFIKCNEIQLHQSAQYQRSISGHTGQLLPIGGLTPEGEDATNELDFLVLEAQKQLRLPQPNLSLLYHDRLSQELLLKAVEVVKTGIGQPQFFNNALGVQHLISQQGASLEEARSFGLVGCVDTAQPHATDPAWGGYLNMPKFLELVLHNGRDPLTGKQIGPQTGDPLTFRSYEELHEAVRRQLRYFMILFNDWEHIGHDLNAEFLPLPFNSALVDDCIKRGKDINAGGSRYNGDELGPVGTIDLADSLAAIKKLVFEEKRITMKGLLEALEADFAGDEELHHMLLEAPKYGNDIEGVDQIARDWYRIFYDEYPKKDHLGRFAAPTAFSASGHLALGIYTGALPCGRKSRTPLTDASVSPEPGKDREGPTALIRSASKTVDTALYRCNQLNMKFHPSALGSVEGMRKLLALIKTYMDLGGFHVQFNVVSADTLKDAQLHPENYRDLVVRVAGFSAFYIHLDKGVQDEIIKRTELRFG